MKKWTRDGILSIQIGNDMARQSSLDLQTSDGYGSKFIENQLGLVED